MSLAATALVCALGGGSAFASASDVGWRDSSGQVVPDSQDQKVVNGFGAFVIVTSDQDWEEKWSTPSDSTPGFTTADEVPFGKKLTILVFFANPKPDAKGDIRITCDLKVTRPDGSTSISQKGVDCASGALTGPPENLRLTQMVAEFIGEAGDPPGQWVVEVIVRDENADATVPLRTGFVLKDSGG
jgi:hypothetical protein